MSFKALSLVALLALVGCSSSKPVAKEPVAEPKPAVAEAPKELPPMPSVVRGKNWSLDIQEPLLWEKRALASRGSMKVEGNWVTTKNFGEGPVSLTVLSTTVEVGLDPVGFIKAIIAEQDKDDNTKFFSLRKVQIESGEVAGLATMGRKTSHGVIGRLELVTSHGNDGFIVTCGGNLEEAEEWQELCVDVLSTFTIR
jgi:hypothetical protein